MTLPSRRSTRSRRRRGAALVHAILFLIGAAAGWFVWPAVMSPLPVQAAAGSNQNATESRVRVAAGPSGGATNGALVIPVKDASGGAREPMILLPVNARLAPSRTVPVDPPSSNSTPVTSHLLLANRPAGSNPVRTAAQLAEQTVEVQIALARTAISPGSIDGLMGSQTRAALRTFQRREGIPATGLVDAPTLERLMTGEPLFTNLVVAVEDLERLLPLSGTWLGKSQQARLDYESILELVAERTMAHPNLIKRLNPAVNWTEVPAGTSLRVPAVAFPEPVVKAARIQIRLAERILQAFDSESNLVAHFPCSIAQRVEKRPVGEELHVSVVAPDPNYTFDPAVFPESAEARELGRKLILQPGPNNPVGSVWIGLDKPGYGIHGTPKPEEVGRTESHGCFRLANWNARHLLSLVVVGTPVEVLP